MQGKQKVWWAHEPHMNTSTSAEGISCLVRALRSLNILHFLERKSSHQRCFALSNTPPETRLSLIMYTIQKMAESPNTSSVNLEETLTWADTPSPQRHISYKHDQKAANIDMVTWNAWNVVGSGELQRKTSASVGWKDERWHAQVQKAWLKDRPLPKSVNSAQRTATPLYDFTFTCTQEHWSNGSAGLRVPYGLHIYWTNNQKESAFKEESKEEHRKSTDCEVQSEKKPFACSWVIRVNSLLFLDCWTECDWL